MAAICQWAYCGHAHEGADCLQCARAMARLGLRLRGCTAAQFKSVATSSESTAARTQEGGAQHG